MVKSLLYWTVVVPGRLRVRVAARMPGRPSPDTYWLTPRRRVRLWLR